MRRHHRVAKAAEKYGWVIATPYRFWILDGTHLGLIVTSVARPADKLKIGDSNNAETKTFVPII